MERNMEMIDNCTQIPTTLQCEDHVKYFGVVLDSNLSCRFHINNVASKISRTVGVVTRLRHLVPRTTFYIFINHWYRLIWHMVWRLGGKLPKPICKKFACFKNESFVWCILLNPESILCLCLFPQKLQMLYAEKVSSIMFDVSCMNAPSNICDFFTKANSKHKHETRFSSSGNYYAQFQDWI